MARWCCSIEIKFRENHTNNRFAAGFLANRRFPAMLFLVLLPFFAIAQEDLLNVKLDIPRQKTTLYEAFNLISQETGCLFVYDSQLVESDKRVKLEADHIPLKTLLDRLLENPRLHYKLLGKHILIYKDEKSITLIAPQQQETRVPDSVKFVVVKGHIFDEQDKKPVPYATVGIVAQNLGTITNDEGFFILKVPARFIGSNLVVSHLGFYSHNIPVKLLAEQKVDIFLERRIISIQEVIIQYIDPEVILRKAIEKREQNYNSQPVYLTSFYREGVIKNNLCVNYSEAIFKVYKSAVDASETLDQVKLLKSRKVENMNPKDTVFLKLKGGIQSGLQLDITKVLPGFLDPQQMGSYVYQYSDIVSNDLENVWVISFEQREDIEEPYYKGVIFVNRDNYAILGADFEINPKFLNKAADELIIRKSRRIHVKLEKISYSINYRLYNGKYYFNHARCDMHIKTRLRTKISSDNFTTFLETATCAVDTLNVVRFPKQEVIKPGIVFSDVKFNYDESFWGEYNIIAPEAKLGEALSRIISKIEQIEE